MKLKLLNILVFFLLSCFVSCGDDKDPVPCGSDEEGLVPCGGDEEEESDEDASFPFCESDDEKRVYLNVTEGELRDRIMTYWLNKYSQDHDYSRTYDIENVSPSVFKDLFGRQSPIDRFKNHFPDAGKLQCGEWDFIRQWLQIEVVRSPHSVKMTTKCFLTVKESVDTETKEQLFNVEISKCKMNTSYEKQLLGHRLEKIETIPASSLTSQ